MDHAKPILRRLCIISRSMTGVFHDNNCRAKASNTKNLQLSSIYTEEKGLVIGHFSGK